MIARITVVVVTAGCAALAVADPAPIRSTFDNDLEGWTALNASIEWIADGGNPGGYLRFTDDIGLSEIVAPAVFQGDLSAYIGGVIRFDLRRFALFEPPESPVPNSLEIVSIERISVGVARAPFVALTIPTVWTTYELPFNASVFQFGGENLPLILADVTDIRISPDFYGLGSIIEMYEIDNIEIVPAPGSTMLGAVGLAALSRRRR